MKIQIQSRAVLEGAAPNQPLSPGLLGFSLGCLSPHVSPLAILKFIMSSCQRGSGPDFEIQAQSPDSQHAGWVPSWLSSPSPLGSFWEV